MNLGLVIVLLLMLHVVMKFNLGQDSEARFGQDFEAQVLWRGWCLVKILKLMLGRDSEDEIWSRFVFELVIWTQPSGPLCLWQCFIYSRWVWSIGHDLSWCCFKTCHKKMNLNCWRKIGSDLWQFAEWEGGDLPENHGGDGKTSKLFTRGAQFLLKLW